jgi:hypothetical protein
MKNNNNKTITDLQVKHISTSKEGIGMYAITFKVGQKKYAQTKHMLASAVNGFTPTIPEVNQGTRKLQKCNFRVGN